MKCKLSDICDFRKGKVEVENLNTKNYISTENMLPNKSGITEATSLPNVSSTQEYKNGDVLVSNIRPYFKKIWQARYDGGCSNDVLVFVPKSTTDRDFLYYLLAYDDFFTYSMATSKGTKMPRGDKTSIMQYEVPMLDFCTQKKIASVLKSLDEKIELNNAINENLEQQAQAIYCDMFITNANPSWQLGRLSDLIAVRYGKNHKKLADGIYPVYGSGGIMRYAEKPLYDKESVLIPRKGTLNNVMYVNKPFWSVDTMFFTEMKLPNVAKFVFHFVKSKDLASLNAGSAVPSMTTDILNAMELSIPDANTLYKFENIVAPMYQAMQQNTQQSSKLAELRDSLLPRLMSGEIDVTDIQI
jgi:type I restriction enzyme S subunit